MNKIIIFFTAIIVLMVMGNYAMAQKQDTVLSKASGFWYDPSTLTMQCPDFETNQSKVGANDYYGKLMGNISIPTKKDGTPIWPASKNCTTADGYHGEQQFYYQLFFASNPITCWYDPDCETTESCGDGIKNGPEFCDGSTISCMINGGVGVKVCKPDCTGFGSCIGQNVPSVTPTPISTTQSAPNIVSTPTQPKPAFNGIEDCIKAFGQNVTIVEDQNNALSCGCASGYKWNSDKTNCEKINIVITAAEQNQTARPVSEFDQAMSFVKSEKELYLENPGGFREKLVAAMVKQFSTLTIDKIGFAVYTTLADVK